MAKHNKYKKTLFFIEGNVASEAEIDASMEFEPGVQFRSAALHRDDAAIETFDRLAGAIPAKYAAVQRAKDGKDAPEGTDDAPAAPAAPTGGAAAPQQGVKPPQPKPGNGWAGNT